MAFPVETFPTMGVGGNFSGAGIGMLAIIGGSGASFKIILSWKIKLVQVPPNSLCFLTWLTANDCKEIGWIDSVLNIGLEGLWKRVLEEEIYMVYIILEPFGGKMNDIPYAAIPF
ncbi:hypothetical protein C5167_028033 [Papaver somniferum]|nr:hypothetical protein C5167_028033 [Papaver somniferum]